MFLTQGTSGAPGLPFLPPSPWVATPLPNASLSLLRQERGFLLIKSVLYSGKLMIGNVPTSLPLSLQQEGGFRFDWIHSLPEKIIDLKNSSLWM